MSAERHEFQTEVQQLLDLMIHSLYTHKDIFLRELISNASDALDRRRFAALTQKELEPEQELQVRLEPDAEARTLSVHDNGIGMSRVELIEHLGTIAKSGTREFLSKLRERQREGAELPPELIGQFGVGFYSSFMVADRVIVLTRRAGEAEATCWESSGDGYTVEPAERAEAGTTVTLHLSPAEPEEGLRDYTDPDVLRGIVRRYSDFVAYPIRMRVERPAGEKEKDDDGAAVIAGDKRVSDETLNSMKAIWTRPATEVGEEEYREFYKHIAHDWNDPLETIRGRMEGTFEASVLLFLPSRAPFDLYHRDVSHRGVQLYVKRIFVMDECRELVPDWLRFVRGVVDSEDLSLNISRELLQHDRQLRAIRSFITKKVLDTLKEMAARDPEKYATFWRELGPVLKEGLIGYEERKDRILELLRAPSTHSESKLTSLDDYLARAREGQDAIYYALGSSREAIEKSPHLEAFREKGYEVLYLTDRVDEVWLQTTPAYKDKPFRAVGKGEVELGSEEERKREEEARSEKEREYGDLLRVLRAHLQDDVKEVRLSSRLTTSPACLVGESHDISPQLEELLRRAGQDVPRIKRILELNPSHPVLAKLNEIFRRDAKAPEIEEAAHVLYGQALLAEGSPLPDPAAFSRRVAALLSKAL